MKYAILWSLVLLSLHVNAAILLDEGHAKNSTIHSKTAEDSFALRKLRRAGIGVSAAGALGLAGISLELNLTPENSFKAGYGGGPGYQSYNIEMKRTMGSGAFLPYMGGGFAHWYTSGSKHESITTTTPNFLAEKFMTEDEKRQGIINENILYPSIGLQFIQLGEPMAGSSIYMELMVLVEVGQMQAVPTGSFGYTYYF